MKLLRSFLSNSVFALNVLLLLLFLFRERLHIPVILQPFGRMHPMLLHLPIGILLLAGLMLLFKNAFKKKSFQNFLNFALYFAAFFAALTAVFGMMLSAEGGYGDILLERHILSGVAVSLVTWGLLLVGVHQPENKKLFYGVFALDIVIVLLAGHFGSVLTHGENFVFQPLMKDPESATIITDSTSMYSAVIFPILKNKCTSCHNEKKSKGGLVMTSAEKISSGSEHGALWKGGDPLNSLLIKRIRLPESNDDHMPPSGKPQLTHVEQQVLALWILNGADMHKAWTKYTPGDSVRILADEFIDIEKKPAPLRHEFAFVPQEELTPLNTPYMTVTPLAIDEPALKADFFLAQGFDSKRLEALLKVKDQIVILNLSGMPLKAADAGSIRQFKNLERILLNKVDVPREIIQSLASLSKLASVSMAGTTTNKSLATELAKAPALKEVFLWNSKTTDDDLKSLKTSFPSIHWDGGFYSTDILRLTPPVVINENFLLSDGELVAFKHSMPNTMIRFTIDGSAPDSVNSTLYQKPIALNGFTHIRAIAVRDGWYASPEVEYYFFKQGYRPINARLLTAPDKNHRGNGVLTLTDLKKGSASNYRESMWLGFRENPMIAYFQMNPSSIVQSVTVSFGWGTGDWILPPQSAEVWAGIDENHLKLLKRIVPRQPDKKEPPHMDALIFEIPESAFPIYKLVINPVPKVPEWISKKPEKGWFFTDEVIFN